MCYSVFNVCTYISDIHEECLQKLVEHQRINNVCYKALPQLNAERLDEECKQAELKSYDYFSNSEFAYILTFVFISAFIVGTNIIYRLVIFFNM